MNLIELGTGYKIQVDPAAYMLIPFKTLWDRDKTKNKEKALKELAFVYYTCDYKSPYTENTSIEERDREVKMEVFGKEDYTIDEEIMAAQEFYRERQKTFSLILLEDAISGITKLSRYLKDINFNENEINERTGEAKPKHDIKKYADTIKTIPDILKSLNALKEAVKKEQESDNNLRAGREKPMYAD